MDIGRISKAHSLRGPLVFWKENEQLACFCLLCWGLLLFLPEALTEAVGLTDKFQNVPLAGEPV